MVSIGLDIGTTSLSAVALDAQTGALLESATVASESRIEQLPQWADCQDPEIIVRKALAIVEALAAPREGAASIGLTGQMHGVLYVDAHGRAVSPLFTWQDARCDERIPGEDATWAERLAALTGYPMATGFGAATHYWHAMNGLVPKGAQAISTIQDYVGMRLTGRKAPLAHISNAASLALFDRAACRFDEAACARAGFSASIFPAVTRQAELLGQTPRGVPVSVAIGDNQAGFIGAVRDMENSVFVSVGTSGQVSMMSSAAHLPNCLESRPLHGFDAILVGSTLCGGRAYAILEGFLRSCARLAGDVPDKLYAAMNDLAMEALTAPDALAIDTRFSGTRQNPALRGSITGIGVHNLTAAHLIGGVLTGIARELSELNGAMHQSGAPRSDTLIGAGNAIRNNPALVRALENAFGMPMRIPAHREETAFGAALFGMTAAGIKKSLRDAQALIRYA